ncbi:hypothetical protein GALMADRAFT_146075 [Galerina marginata CBS 339.88]|uniref:F-box domain-containing protein n=1 Tax=Galerina marginata (strain CBS 339.88) TaxID=685588 RepID=A0A067SPL4_GALM3|nr:hypothetical protein GALMADRAFT_146075 [Galerina marginata CBS 339.88]
MPKRSKRSKEDKEAGPPAKKRGRPSKNENQELPKPEPTYPESGLGQPIIELGQATPRVNTSGLATFPDELLLEVMSYYPPIPLPTVEPQPPIDADAQIERRETLAALSHTCSNLRRFFRPYIWQRIEVVSGMPVGNRRRVGKKTKANERLSNQELLRQLEIVTIRDTSLSEYVNVINVEIKDYSSHSVLEELARCMAVFPNLHTVKLLVLVDPLNAFDTEKIFAKHSYPQIRTAMVSTRGFPLLRSCPGVQFAYSTEDCKTGHLTRVMLHSCPLLQNLYLDVPEAGLEEIVSAFPEVRTLELHFGMLGFSLHAPSFALISGFKRLKNLELRAAGSITHNMKDEVLVWAKNLLLELQKVDKEEKLLCLYYSEPSDDYLTKEISIVLPVPEPLQGER